MLTIRNKTRRISLVGNRCGSTIDSWWDWPEQGMASTYSLLWRAKRVVCVPLCVPCLIELLAFDCSNRFRLTVFFLGRFAAIADKVPIRVARTRQAVAQKSQQQ
jgi:hypothetical protein